jgi:hypothetical protein
VTCLAGKIRKNISNKQLGCPFERYHWNEKYSKCEKIAHFENYHKKQKKLFQTGH